MQNLTRVFIFSTQFCKIWPKSSYFQLCFAKSDQSLHIFNFVLQNLTRVFIFSTLFCKIWPESSFFQLCFAKSDQSLHIFNFVLQNLTRVFIFSTLFCIVTDNILCKREWLWSNCFYSAGWSKSCFFILEECGCTLEPCAPRSCSCWWFIFANSWLVSSN